LWVWFFWGNAVYRVDLIPRGIWIISGIAVLLILLLAFSVALSMSRGQAVVIGPEVKTGNPADYIKKPPTPPTPTAPTPTPPPVVTPAPTATPSPPPAPKPGIPAGLPSTITFGGRTWRYSGGPVQINVITTGQLTGNLVIYRKQGEQPPYKALYLESAPNSGEFYKYVPAAG
jgi:hypothetical protein